MGCWRAGAAGADKLWRGARSGRYLLCACHIARLAADIQQGLEARRVRLDAARDGSGESLHRRASVDGGSVRVGVHQACQHELVWQDPERGGLVVHRLHTMIVRVCDLVGGIITCIPAL